MASVLVILYLFQSLTRVQACSEPGIACDYKNSNIGSSSFVGDYIFSSSDSSPAFDDVADPQNQSKCCGTRTNWYTYPGFPQAQVDEIFLDPATTGTENFDLFTPWTTNTGQSYLVVLTHEDDDGLVYGSDSFILIHESHSSDTAFINAATDAS